MNNIFNFFSINGGLAFGSALAAYKPYINYSWSSTYQANNQMYSTNTGTGTDLQLYSGQGVKFNGVDQSVEVNEVDTSTVGTVICRALGNNIRPFGRLSDYGTFCELTTNSTQLRLSSTVIFFDYRRPINTLIDVAFIINIGTVDLYINGVHEESKSYIGAISNNSPIKTIGKINIAVGDGILKDLFIFNRAITQAEITKYSTNPNGFFNDALVDDTCVLNMPLAEHSDYCIDYANYSEEEVNTIFSGFTQGTETSTLVYSTNTSFRCNITTVGVANRPRIEFDIPSTDSTKDMYLTFEVTSHSGSFSMSQLYLDGLSAVLTDIEPNITTVGVHTIKINNTTDGLTKLYLYISGNILGDTELKNIRLFTASGVHQIQNYTDSCRDEAKQLPYGSQNANYKINGLGVRTDESPYFEGSELFDNHGDTGWIPSATEDWSIETTQDLESGDTYEYNGNSFTNGVLFGKDLNLNQYAIKLFGSSKIVMSSLPKYPHIIIAYTGATTKTFAIYADGTPIYTEVNITSTSAVQLAVTLGNRQGVYPLTNDLRLFKVHQKAITQEEVAKAYTDAVNKGLLV